MSTLERKREFASLLALGTQQIELKLQIFFETFIFGIIACPLGSLLGVGLAKWMEGYDIMNIFEDVNPEDMEIGGFGMDYSHYTIFFYIPDFTNQPLFLLCGFVIKYFTNIFNIAYFNYG